MLTAFPPDPLIPDVESFIAYWQGREGGQERANYQLFLIRLCRLLNLPEPDAADATHERNDYVFERAVQKQWDGEKGHGWIDFYRRGSFVLEAKQSRLKGGTKEVPGTADLFGSEVPDDKRGKRGADRAWDALMKNAKRQAEDYARALPTSHGWPPFILVCDVGHCIEVFADFSGQGKNYTQFPDRQGFRIYLEDLRKPEVRERLQRIWLDPHSLDPTRIAAKATREIAERLAAVSKALEAKKYPAEDVALFLMRSLFTMFAEDVGLLPEESFKGLLEECRKEPKKFIPLVEDLWRSMNEGVFAASIRERVLRFNGNLFKDARALPLEKEDIGELAEAAAKNWREVEPAIFGTLLEQALDKDERKRLGAHYTPRAYVERLVVATVIEPLREDWRQVQSVAEAKREAGNMKAAAAEVRAFHDKLCQTLVLDPACGTGNFLYVSLELMKRLEGEVLEALVDLGGQEVLTGLEAHTIDPHQFLGLELNPRAAAIAELVLWIGYLQWHFRTKGGVPSEPILKAFKNIEVKNAVLAWDGYPHPVMRDGVETYPNARRPDWPAADFIVGNPPFIGGKDLRARLGDAPTEALWAAHRHINESADFVMYWWDRAAELLTIKGTRLRRFGFVTTNSITQEFSRRVIKKRMEARTPISLLMAIADHPWTKATRDAAAVRIAMTVAAKGKHDGVLREVVKEEALDTDAPEVKFEELPGQINTDLSVGVDVTSTVSLRSNTGIASRGVTLCGSGFLVSKFATANLGLGYREGLEEYLRPFLNGRDLTQKSRGAFVIDLFGLSADEVRRRYPEIYSHLLEHVKGERDKNSRASYRDQWWIFCEPRADIRPALLGLDRYIASTRTAKHRVFSYVDGGIIAESEVIVFAFQDAFSLGILSSQIHVIWSYATGGWLGAGNDSRYTNSRCFDPFPFPLCDNALKMRIRTVAEELDAFRKTRQEEHPNLTLTQMYNVLEKLKAGATLTPDDERIKDEGLILILKELHEKLDTLVFEAYGWPKDLSDEEILTRLVALNAERAAEEKRGIVHWLRPDYQIPRFAKTADKQAVAEEGTQELAQLVVLEREQKRSFPTSAIEQAAEVFSALAAARGPLDAAMIASNYKQGKKAEPKIAAILVAASRIGEVATLDGGRTFAFRRVA
ncbi:class I SAM-dependent DNA methyltransferase [Microvirga sp. ACRRW]|uniref:class I SAM-dependent DNA methyltransferase n=1 Tax=Microvirga sp. ACRRW TaxID=2918205 RepID=UPI001EF4A02A|nr:DNA methyltransferase [Microvirga sp. ACRRW]MCG7393981.1 class I SAM-dependent DNA methyltransferase [Microvirga sp. ACRRW]